MADRSLIYFLFFLIVWFGYSFYQESEESARLFKIASDQQETIKEQDEAIRSQKLYIHLLEIRYLDNLPLENSDSPLYNRSL